MKDKQQWELSRERTKLEHIEDCWAGPMANTTNTRIRFAMWELTKYLAEVAGSRSSKAKAAILAELEKEKSRYDEHGFRKFRTAQMDSKMSTTDSL